MKFYKLPEDVRNGIANYLATRPWQEVNEGMQALLNLTELSEETEKKADES